MSVLEDAPQQAAGDSDTNRSGELTERGCYGRALREGLVPKPSAAQAHALNAFLWGLNVAIWLLASAFVLWRLYVSYFATGA